VHSSPLALYWEDVAWHEKTAAKDPVKPTKESFAALANSLTKKTPYKKTPYKGLGVDSEEKHEPVSDIDTAMVVDSLKALDPKRPIREADIINRCLAQDGQAG
jgi:hypothetical protein